MYLVYLTSARSCNTFLEETVSGDSRRPERSAVICVFLSGHRALLIKRKKNCTLHCPAQLQLHRRGGAVSSRMTRPSLGRISRRTSSSARGCSRLTPTFQCKSLLLTVEIITEHEMPAQHSHCDMSCEVRHIYRVLWYILVPYVAQASLSLQCSLMR